MSRYHVKVGDATYAYGYDRPLREYFLQKHTPGEGDYPDVEDIVGSYTGNGYGSAGELLKAVQELGIPLPEEHLTLIGMDLPF